MRLKSLSITAGVLAILAAGLAPLAFHPDATQAASSAKQDLAGTWVLDKSKSDKPPAGFGGRGQGGHGGHGEHAGGEMGPPPGGGGPEGMHRGGGGKGGGGGMRRGLPRLMRITGGAQGYSVADSSGTIVEDITFEPVSSQNADKMPPQVQGAWKDDKLVVTRSGQKGGSMTQTFELDKGGNELTVRTKAQRKDVGEFEMKRVYTRQH